MATTSPVGRHRVVARASLTALLLCCEVAIVALVGLVWVAQLRGQVRATDVATMDLLGISAAVGVVVVAFVLAATVAVIRNRRGRGLAATGWSLAWLRLAGVLVGAGAIAVSLGLDAVVGLVETFAVGLAVLDAAVAVAVAGTARRLARVTPVPRPA